MAEFMDKPLAELFKDLVADGMIDGEEVKKLRERLYTDGVIDRAEAEFLFQINDAVSGKNNDPAWKDLFVEAIASHVLTDPNSPGVIDEEEGNWLAEKLVSDGKIDETEQALLAYIKRNAKSISGKLSSL